MMKLDSVAGKTYLVFGFGKSGKATAHFLQDNEARVIVWDDNEDTRILAQQAGYETIDPKSIQFKELEGVILAPGIPLTHEVVEKARFYKRPLLSDIHFLFEANPKATFIGVTGTNGKSTTTALTTHIIHASGKRAQMGGNIGMAALSLEPMGKDDICVLELSSYQLDLIEEHPLKTAAILNLTPDHLTHHGDMANYVAAKANIIQTDKKQTLVIGTDEDELKELLSSIRPTCPKLKIYEMAQGHKPEGGIHLLDGKFTIGDKSIDLTYCKTLSGVHNTQNAAAAYILCEAVGLTHEEIEKGLRSFPGLPHRQQLVATIKGIRYINDSKATNANATAKALETYPDSYWIVGGRAKETGLDGLEDKLANVKHAFLIGEAEEEFAKWCEGKVSFTRCGTLEVALKKANIMSEGDRGATILLSPACASWDQFDSFEHRGDHFIQLVHELTKGL